jgi:hypothetical protein
MRNISKEHYILGAKARAPIPEGKLPWTWSRYFTTFGFAPGWRFFGLRTLATGSSTRRRRRAWWR